MFFDSVVFLIFVVMKKYSKEERELAVELWQESGLSQGDFCKQESIARSTFQNWVKQYGQVPVEPKENIALPSAGFVSVKLRSSVNSISSIQEPLTVHYPNGVKLTGLAGLSHQELLALIGME